MGVSNLLLFDTSTAGYSYEADVSIEMNEIFRRVKGAVGDGELWGRTGAQGSVADTWTAHRQEYEYRAKTTGLNGAVRFSEWVG